jgi:nucleotide-binding universal stress UspA family protein
MFNNVLLTVDLNDDASWKAALPQAVALVRASKGTLHVMTVVPDFGSAMVASLFPADFREKALAQGEAALEDLISANVPTDITAVPHLGYGQIHEEVLKGITKVKADLVVMASHAPDRMREFLVGSQADRIVRRSPVSVLVVRG